MPIVIRMPALSPTMSSGTLAHWLKHEGEMVRAGDTLAEIETDKATLELDAVEDGTLARILVPDGSSGIAVGTPIALLLEEGEVEEEGEVKEEGKGEGDDDTSAHDAAAPHAPPVARPTPSPPPQLPPPQLPPPRLMISPLARRLAAEAGLDVTQITGSGPNGRVVKADIIAAQTSTTKPTPAPLLALTPASVPEDASAAAPITTPIPVDPDTLDAESEAMALGLRYQRLPHSPMRHTIARRLSYAKRTAPHFYLTMDCRMDALADLRQHLNTRTPDTQLSLNDLMVRALALALRQVPEANAAWSDRALIRYENIDLAVAVATPGGLMTPVLRQADQKGLATIAAELHDLATRARAGALRPEEYQGGSFTLSNLGMYGVREFAAILNPPQAGILALGTAEPRPVVQNGMLAVAKVMTATLSADHRVIDGTTAAMLLGRFRELVEDPLRMLL